MRWISSQITSRRPEDTTQISAELCKGLLSRLENCIDNYNLIVLSDYLKGLLTFDFTQGIIKIANENHIPVVIDVKDPSVYKYKNATLLKPNQKELDDLTGIPVDTNEEIVIAAEYLRKQCNNKYVLCTCGARGMVLVDGSNSAHFVPAECREVFDVSGAGDTTIAYLAAAMANGIDMNEAVAIANYAAGIQVGKVGTSSVFLYEVRDYLSNKDTGSFHKILSTAVLIFFMLGIRDILNRLPPWEIFL